jgi:hypothetical protein
MVWLAGRDGAHAGSGSWRDEMKFCLCRCAENIVLG